MIQAMPLTSPETGPKDYSAQRRAVGEAIAQCSVVSYRFLHPSAVIYPTCCAGGAEDNHAKNHHLQHTVADGR